MSNTINVKTLLDLTKIKSFQIIFEIQNWFYVIDEVLSVIKKTYRSYISCF